MNGCISRPLPPNASSCRPAGNGGASIAPHASLTHSRLSELIGDGYGFVIHEGPEPPEPPTEAEEQWPVVALTSNGSLSFRSPDDEFETDDRPDQKVVWLQRVRAPPEQVHRRKWLRSRLRSAA